MTDFFNRVMFRSTTDGLVDFGVGTAMTGYNTPAQRGVTDETIVSYTAESDDRTEWETGSGSYDVGTLTVRRTTIRESSNSNLIVNFAAEPKVWLDYHAQDVVNELTQIIAGSGLTGGGTLEADRTLNIGAGAGITVNANDVALTIPVTVINTLDNLTSIQGFTVTFADAGFDVLTGWDDSAAAHKNFLLADIATEAVPAAGDFVLIYGAEGDLRRVDWDDLPGGGGGSGDVVGPASATDNAVARFDGTTGKLIQDSNMTLADNGDLLQAVTRPSEALTWDGGNVDALGQFNVLLRSGEVANNQIAFNMLMDADNGDTVVDIDKDFKVNILDGGAFRLTAEQGLEITLTGGDVTMQVDDGSFNVNCSGKVTVDCVQDCQWTSETSMQFVVIDGTNNTVVRIFMAHDSAGDPLVGFGSGIAFRFEAGNPGAFHMGAIDCTLTDDTVDENHTDLRFYTMVEGAENIEQMRLSRTTTATHTSMLLWDTDNGTLERVTVGAADSGGTGFKVLRIPN